MAIALPVGALWGAAFHLQERRFGTAVAPSRAPARGSWPVTALGLLTCQRLRVRMRSEDAEEPGKSWLRAKNI